MCVNDEDGRTKLSGSAWRGRTEQLVRGGRGWKAAAHGRTGRGAYYEWVRFSKANYGYQCTFSRSRVLNDIVVIDGLDMLLLVPTSKCGTLA